MNSKRFLISIQFLGFRYHGVQKLTNFQSVQERVERALLKNFEDQAFKIRFASRLDKMVSAHKTYCLVMFNEEVLESKLSEAFSFLPPDIRVLDIKKVADDFTLMKNIGLKEYHYYFSFNQRSIHPFCAPFMTNIQEDLNINIMKEGAKLFEGTHDFKNYAYKPKPNGVFERTIEKCELMENDFLKANFFPERSYVLIVTVKGFMRGQIRLMVGALIRLGKNEITVEELKISLKKVDPTFIKWLAPASGLILHQSEVI